MGDVCRVASIFRDAEEAVETHEDGDARDHRDAAVKCDGANEVDCGGFFKLFGRSRRLLGQAIKELSQEKGFVQVVAVAEGDKATDGGDVLFQRLALNGHSAVVHNEL